eukprot:gene133-220_t
MGSCASRQRGDDEGGSPPRGAAHGGGASGPAAAAGGASGDNATAGASGAGASGANANGSASGANGTAGSAGTGPPPPPNAAPPQQRQGAGSQRQSNKNPVREQPVVESLITVDTDKLKIVKDGDDEFRLQIHFDSQGIDVEVSARFNAHVKDPQAHREIPQVSGRDLYTQRVPSAGVGSAAEISGIPGALLADRTMADATEKELPNDIPLVLHLRSLSDPYKSDKVNAVWLFCNLQPKMHAETKALDGYSVWCVKRIVARSGRGYLLQNLFGQINDAKRMGGSEDPADGQECVVCLTAPREVVVLHCKHVCLCKACASVTR